MYQYYFNKLIDTFFLYYSNLKDLIDFSINYVL